MLAAFGKATARIPGIGRLWRDWQGVQQAQGNPVQRTAEKMKALALKGQQYGRLKVLRRVPSPRATSETGTLWLCRCQCGEDIIVSVQRLRKGITRSCGCLRRELVSRKYLFDLTGQVFGRLHVIKRAQTARRTKTRQAFWLCSCICGATTVVVSQALRSGHTRSCGCLLGEISAERLKRYKEAFKKDPALQARWREKWEPSLGFTKTKAFREKMAKITKANWAKPEVRARREQGYVAMDKEAWKQRQREATLRSWQNPVHRKRRLKGAKVAAKKRRKLAVVRIPGRTVRTDAQVFAILARRFFGHEAYDRIAADVGISRAQVIRICQGKRHRERVERWKALNRTELR